MLLEAGWDPKEANSWIDPRGEEWTAAEDTNHDMEDYAEIVYTVGEDTKKRQWQQAATGWQGAGLEEGPDSRQLRNRLRNLTRAGEVEIDAIYSPLPQEDAGHDSA